MKKNKILSIIPGLIATFLLVGVAYSDSPSTATSSVPIEVKNTTTTTVTDVVGTIPLAHASLVAGGAITSTGFNMHFHEGTNTNTPFMPASNKIDVKYAFDNAGVDKTSQATNTTVDDVNLPAANGEMFEFALDHPSRVLHFNISQGAAATSYVIDWEYYNGSGWVYFSIFDTPDEDFVTDNTSSFSTLGDSIVIFKNAPDDWALSTLHTTKQGFWVRAVATASGVTTVPLATQVWYETARAFFNVDSLDSSTIGSYNLYYGGNNDPLFTSHYYFPGFAGIVTADDADLEPSGSWSWLGDVGLKIDSGLTGDVIKKTGSINLTFNGAASIGGNNTLVFNAPATARYGEWTHNEEDGSSYYSGTGFQSHSKTFYNAASNYITAHQEDAADLLSNTGSSNEVTDHKVGQAYDKVNNTTAAFGAKLNDPS